MKNLHNLQKDFPQLQRFPQSVYLDSAATALVPQVVLDAMADFYTQKANVHRGAHTLSMQATAAFESARADIAAYIGATSNEIFFTSGTTAGLNQLAYGLEQYVGAGDEIVVTRLEHHANLIPWQQLCARRGAKLRFIELTDSGEIDLDSARVVITARTKIIAMTHVSNTLGVVVPIAELVALARAQAPDALTIVDAAQSVAHGLVNVQELGADFVVFSGHKLYGPTGVGVVYGRSAALELLQPALFGGGMISSVSYEKAEWGGVPARFEAGTPPIAEVIGLGAAVRWLSQFDREEVRAYEAELMAYTLVALSKIPQVRVLAPSVPHVGVVSFVVEGAHAYDVGALLDAQGVAVRVGHHCTQPLLEMLGVPVTVRISLGIYTTREDIDRAVAALQIAVQKLS